MSLVHSNENIPAMSETYNSRQCSVCRKDYEIDDIIVSTPCSHVFHKECIVKVLNETQGCPVCGKACRQTKLKSHNILAEAEKQTPATPAPNNTNITNQGAIPKAPTQNRRRRPRNFDNTLSQTTGLNRNNSRSFESLLNISQENVNSQNAQQTQDIQNISDSTLQYLINEAVRSQLASLNINPNTTTRPSFGNQNNNNNILQNRNNNAVTSNVGRSFGYDNNQTNTSNTRQSFGFRNSNNNLNRNVSNRRSHYNQNQNLNLTTDKICNIISGWHLKFSGQEEDSLTVDNFIYRVHALTLQSLRGDFDILCRHAHILFSGKAMDWFWRFHRTADRLDWETLCVELKKQFRDRRTDFDLKEQIRSRKQRIGEKFDAYYDAVLQIIDRLQNPIADYELIEILKRNLRPEIRKELLHFDIQTISQLKEFVRKHEILDEELDGRRSNRSFIPRKIVSEIEPEGILEEEPLQIDEIKEFVCWNCSEKGHRFEDCLAERRIFCYGCGTPNIFKPNCSKCNKFSKNYQTNNKQKQFQSRGTQM